MLRILRRHIMNFIVIAELQKAPRLAAETNSYGLGWSLHGKQLFDVICLKFATGGRGLDFVVHVDAIMRTYPCRGHWYDSVPD